MAGGLAGSCHVSCCTLSACPTCWPLLQQLKPEARLPAGGVGNTGTNRLAYFKKVVAAPSLSRTGWAPPIYLTR